MNTENGHVYLETALSSSQNCIDGTEEYQHITLPYISSSFCKSSDSLLLTANTKHLTKSKLQTWRDVGNVLLTMDATYDASFHGWIKCEDNVPITAGHLKRLLADYEVADSSRGLRWLISDWSLQGISALFRRLFTNDMWDQKIEESDIPQNSHQQSSDDLNYSFSSGINNTLTKMDDDIQGLGIFSKSSFTSTSVVVDASTFCMSKIGIPLSNVTTTKLCLEGRFHYQISNVEFARRLAIMKSLTETWSSHHLAQLLTELMDNWNHTLNNTNEINSTEDENKITKQQFYFLREFMRGWPFQKVTEVFMLMGSSTVQFSVKVALLKIFGSMTSLMTSPSNISKEFIQKRRYDENVRRLRGRQLRSSLKRAEF